MNAPTPAAALAEPTLQTIAIDKLRVSYTHIQELRRARFDKTALAELADSIRKVGLLQPIVATPYKKPLKTHRQKIAASTAKSRTDNAKDKADKVVEEKIQQAQAIAIYQAAPTKLSKPMLLHIFGRMVDDYDFEVDAELAAILGIPHSEGTTTGQILKKLGALSETDLTRAFIAVLIARARIGYDQREAKEALSWVKVDLKKIEAKVRDDAKKHKVGTQWPFPTNGKHPVDQVKAASAKRAAKVKSKAKKKGKK